ncbi:MULTISPECIES: DNA repair protein [Streptococcus]|uniref:DNA repair protein n=1 Tax=Streptococcus TaxID=1301 RepID=UPI0023F8256F|nr:DNA repair protein [Streptococcus orisratti]
MKEKQLRKLKRIELYEIMLAQADEIDRLKTELAQAEAELADKRIKIAEAGSLAQASLQLTKVFEEAQKTADLYLTNIKANVGEVDEG